MGVVFQARHIFLKTSHAIKVILPDLVGNDPMLVTRFRQEALAAAAIRHQNIIAVTDFGVVRGTMPFLVMEFVNGKSLQDILADEKKMSPERALEFTCAIGAGVSAAHRQNIVHRDLKPLNIMTQSGQSISEAFVRRCAVRSMRTFGEASREFFRRSAARSGRMIEPCGATGSLPKAPCKPRIALLPR